MENNYGKYIQVRGNLKDGDIFLFRGKSWISRAIQFFDKAYYNHTGVGLWIYIGGEKRYCIIDMNEDDRNGNGCHIDWMSIRIKSYIDFSVVRPIDQKNINGGINLIQNYSEEKVGYDFGKIPMFIFYSLLKNPNAKRIVRAIFGKGRSNKFICSELVQKFCIFIGIKCYDDYEMFSPQDIMRHIDTKEIEIVVKPNNI